MLIAPKSQFSDIDAYRNPGSGYFDEKRNNISEINISLKKHFLALCFVNGTFTFVSSSCHACTMFQLICL